MDEFSQPYNNDIARNEASRGLGEEDVAQQIQYKSDQVVHEEATHINYLLPPKEMLVYERRGEPIPYDEFYAETFLEKGRLKSGNSLHNYISSNRLMSRRRSICSQQVQPGSLGCNPYEQINF